MIGRWLRAFRLRTLPVTLAAVALASFLAATRNEFSALVAILTLTTALLLQILSNLANDFGDSKHGADFAGRVGPQRSVQSGEITAVQMKKAILWTASLAFVSGCFLLLFAFDSPWLLAVFLLLGLAAIWAAINYTAGSKPYGYVGLGDLAVFLFFGWLGTGGSYFLQTQSFDWSVLLPASALGMLVVAVLNINNLRDLESDRKAGKNTLPVRLGRRNAAIYHNLLLWTPVLLSIAYNMYPPSGWEEWIWLLILPALADQSLAVGRLEKAGLDPYLKRTAMTSLAYAFLFGLGQFLIIEA